MPKNLDTIDLHVLVAAVDGTWIAQAVECHLYAQANSLDALKKEFSRVVRLHIKDSVNRGRVPFESLGPAPKQIRDAFDAHSTEINFTPPIEPAVTVSSLIANSMPADGPGYSECSGQVCQNLFRPEA